MALQLERLDCNDFMRAVLLMACMVLGHASAAALGGTDEDSMPVLSDEVQLQRVMRSGGRKLLTGYRCTSGRHVPPTWVTRRFAWVAH